MKINFKLFTTFLAVAENGSFRKAAEQTHLSLPAVSMQIKQLEERLGVAVFQRTTRKVELTREGEELMVSTRKAMAELDGTLARIQKAADVQHGQLSLGCVPTVAGTRLPALLVKFAKTYPAISVSVRELSQPELLEAVRRREVDFGIGPMPDKPGELEFQPIFVDDAVALMPAALVEPERTSISLGELARLPLPLLSLGASQFQHHLSRALDEEDIALELSYVVTHVSTLVAMAEAGLGICILPAMAAPRATTLKALHIVRPSLSRTIAVVTVRGHTLSPAATRFVQLCDMLASPVPPSSLPAPEPVPRRKRAA
ncbi:MAG: LysR family transcriptional regulator [Comamonadaceae bacterium]|nr:MAG: LysR family transcriptional regulator [Comamonadaceae bacterium]